ncbi:MAG: hypothetical protein JWR74_2260 [Polaromonas sp.]|jgi:spore coat protein U-like protein|nr:hypothetical protein [Polaromonas sp.]
MKIEMSKLVLTVVVVLAANGAMAAIDTTTMNVTASIAKACVVGTPTEMAFGTLALIDAASGLAVTTGNADAVGTFSTTCTTGATGVTFTFAGAAAAGFALTGGATTINYSLFSDTNRAVPLVRGTAAGSGGFAGFAADGASHVLSVYGRIDLAANVAKPVASYSDSVLVTVTYD